MAHSARPHILLLSCHDIGRYVGCYGVQTVETPHLDALSAAGARFTRAFTTAPSCSPSRGSLATGRYPHSNGLMGLAHPPYPWSLAPGEHHIASLLHDAGYETHLFGHQHVTHDIASLGFDHLHGFDELRGCHEHALGANVVHRMDEYLAGAEIRRPLYIEVNLEEPHRPYHQGGARPDVSRGVTVPPYLPNSREAIEEMAAFQGAVRQGDAAVGHILQALAEAGLADNLLVIFVADHGVAMPRAKCTLYDPGIEIALLMRWPNHIRPGTVIPEMISNVDILPTILQIVGAPIPDNVQGHSFLPLLTGVDHLARTAIYAEKTVHTYYDPMRAIRTERFKYIRNFEIAPRVEVPTDVQRGAIFRADPGRYHDVQHWPVELYDLSTDPWEQQNLAGNPAYGTVENWLESRLWSWMIQTRDPLLTGCIPSPDAARIIRLAEQFTATPDRQDLTDLR